MRSQRIRDPFAFLLPCRGSLQKNECLRFAYRHLNTSQCFLSLFSFQRTFPPHFFLLILPLFLIVASFSTFRISSIFLSPSTHFFFSFRPSLASSSLILVLLRVPAFLRDGIRHRSTYRYSRSTIGTSLRRQR